MHTEVDTNRFSSPADLSLSHGKLVRNQLADFAQSLLDRGGKRGQIDTCGRKTDHMHLWGPEGIRSHVHKAVVIRSGWMGIGADPSED